MTKNIEITNIVKKVARHCCEIINKYEAEIKKDILEEILEQISSAYFLEEKRRNKTR